MLPWGPDLAGDIWQLSLIMLVWLHIASSYFPALASRGAQHKPRSHLEVTYRALENLALPHSHRPVLLEYKIERGRSGDKSRTGCGA